MNILVAGTLSNIILTSGVRLSPHLSAPTYSDDLRLYAIQLFEILSIYASIHQFLFGITLGTLWDRSRNTLGSLCTSEVSPVIFLF